MIGEVDIGGVFTPTLLVWSVATLALSLPLRWVLSRLGVYRFVWHRGLFDLSLMVILLGAVTALSTKFPSVFPHP
ncbi:MAG: DUF1656 domain-containing protein [Caulobacteraceae bacterium]|nr:DUF1656 domain-containing protein [Caulobacteraceae bacterium]